MDYLKEKIRAEALRLGFSFIGFAKPQQTPHFPQFFDWLEKEIPSGLDYLGKKYVLDGRSTPSILLKNVGTVITVGITYQGLVFKDGMSPSENNNIGILASYACLPDYHKWLKNQAKELSVYIKENFKASLQTKFFVDSGPVMEKDFAFASGLGWIGKNSLFISPDFGSYTLLGCLFVDIDIEADLPNYSDLCGTCTACIKACPTQAINLDKTINAAKCISYLTTNKEHIISLDLRENISNRIFGCDICQQTCPINIKAQTNSNYQAITILPEIINEVDLPTELSLTENDFSKKYLNTPILKLSYEYFLRNLIIAVGNSRLKTFINPLTQFFMNHPSPLIRSTSAWALTQIDFENLKDLILEILTKEENADIRNEVEFILESESRKK